MHDLTSGAARATFAELEVEVDADQATTPRKRSPTDGRGTMQVLIDGAYHRRTPDLAMTPCRLRIPTQFAPLRRQALEGTLCATCFSDFELELAAEANALRNLGTR